MIARDDILDIDLRREGRGRAVRARNRRAHGRRHRGQGRRQGGDPAGRHHHGRLDRRRLRARRGAQGGARGARRRPLAARLGSAAGRARRTRASRPGEERAGVRFAKNMCPSQGTMDIFVEPVMPRPQVVVCGSSPVAVAIADLGRRIGFAVTVCAPAAEQAAFAEADRRIEGYALPVDGGRRALRRGVDAGPRRRGRAAGGARDRCRLRRFRRQPQEGRGAEGSPGERGVAAERLAKLKAPAGLDLGAITPDEIAISILAEIVAVRRSKHSRSGASVLE